MGAHRSIVSAFEVGLDWCVILVVAYPLDLPILIPSPFNSLNYWIIRIIAFPGSTHLPQSMSPYIFMLWWSACKCIMSGILGVYATLIVRSIVL